MNIDRGADSQYPVDLRPFRGRTAVFAKNERRGITSIDNKFAVYAAAPQAGVLAAIHTQQERYLGTLEDFAFAQYARFHILDEGQLSRVIDYDRILSTNAPISRPHTAALVMTKRCNLRCLHCYNNSGKKGADELTAEEKLRCVEFLGRWGIAQLVLTGGEPTLDPSLPEILRLAAQHRLRVKLTTNGWHLHPALLRAVNEGVVYQVNVSLDGSDAETHDRFRGRVGSYMRVLKSLEILSQTKLPNLVINASVHRASLGQLEELTKVAVDLGCAAISFKAVVSTGRPGLLEKNFLLNPGMVERFRQSRDRLRRVYGHLLEVDGKLISSGISEEAREEVSCHAGRQAMVIDADGAMLPCETLEFVKSAPNFRRLTPSQAWAADPLFSWFRDFSSRSSGGCGSAGCPGCQARSCLSSSIAEA